jgi:hypothetical protein
MSDSKRFLLRLDPRLFAALRRWADDDLRSVNGQIEYLLTDVTRRAGRLSHARGKRSSSDGGASASDSHPDEPEALLAVAGGM